MSGSADREGAPPGGEGATATVRTLERRDGPALRGLAEACPVEADFTLLFDRGADVWAWPELVFERWRYAGAEREGRLVGAALAATNTGRVHGGVGPWFYLGDVRVHPEARGQGLVSRLVDHLVDGAWEDVSEGFGIVKRENRAGEGAADLLCEHPRFEGSRVATLDVALLPVLGGFRGPRGVEVRRGGPADAGAITALLDELGAGRRFAPVLEEAAMAGTLAGAGPGSAGGRAAGAAGGGGAAGWWVAERRGQVVGALRVLDLDAVHGQRVLRYSARALPLRAALALLRLARPGLAPLPAPGGRLRVLTTGMVLAGEPGVLRALLGAALGAAYGTGVHLISVPFVGEDPLRPALDGLPHQSFPSTLFHSRRRGARIPAAGRPWVELAWI